LAGGVTMILFDRNFNTAFYDVLGGGDLYCFNICFGFLATPKYILLFCPFLAFVPLFWSLLVAVQYLVFWP
jgi:heme/copper-type cytochrome/quinol oxidase subunit 1